MVQHRKAAVLINDRQADTAMKTLQPALNKLQQLHTTVPADQVILNALSDALLLTADIAELRADVAMQDHCDSVRVLLRPLVNNSSDFHLLAPWVRAHACMNQSEQVGQVKKQLEAMQYRDAAYLQYLSTHQAKKANS
jgi:hypothetical protein